MDEASPKANGPGVHGRVHSRLLSAIRRPRATRGRAKRQAPFSLSAERGRLRRSPPAASSMSFFAAIGTDFAHLIALVRLSRLVLYRKCKSRAGDGPSGLVSARKLVASARVLGPGFE